MSIRPYKSHTAPRRKTLRAYGWPFSQIATNSESIPRRGFFGIHASIAQWLPNAPALRQGELVLSDNSVC
ncbi:hypothetical protein [Shewanella dokdonensis]|uniref:Transposase n=1 Tax=Shewanella dokdonensis TaxID=712036 RepID=A0ABX8DC89_9GAMM|nr:hypothetical protein [Shewanella dokdonensis]MCL1074606.1 hypothetical protein [Shewanella dokdonensis]QVK22382.1 hypothetical protein KHX94_13450 [Shewanella dokdonensis]